jgi:hypothetical protein
VSIGDFEKGEKCMTLVNDPSFNVAEKSLFIASD